MFCRHRMGEGKAPLNRQPRWVLSPDQAAELRRALKDRVKAALAPTVPRAEDRGSRANAAEA